MAHLSRTEWIIGLALVILVIQAVVWNVLVQWLRRRTARALDQLLRNMASSGEQVERGPDPGAYTGSSGGFPRVGGNGRMLLTDQRLVFQKVTGGRVEVPLDEITGVRENKWFAGHYRNGREHLILQTPRGEVSFILKDHEGWMATIQAMLAARAQQG